VSKGKPRFLRNPVTGVIVGWNPILGRRSDLEEISEREAMELDGNAAVAEASDEVPEVTVVEDTDTTVAEGSEVAVTDYEDGKAPPDATEILEALSTDG
jgi:hypothetical protein